MEEIVRDHLGNGNDNDNKLDGNDCILYSGNNEEPRFVQ